MKRTILKILLIYAIRDIIFSLSFSYLGQGLYKGVENFFNFLFYSIIFIAPTVILNFIITGIPVYFILTKKIVFPLKMILFFVLLLVDLIVNSVLFNLSNNTEYSIIRIILYVISILFLTRISKYNQS